MQLLTATRHTQGQSPGDYCHAIEGELVYPAVVCLSGEIDPDNDPCGCSRAWAGMASSKTTTTALVREIDTSFADLVAALTSTLDRQGWTGLPYIDELAASLVELGASFECGVVVTRLLDDVTERISA